MFKFVSCSLGEGLLLVLFNEAKEFGIKKRNIFIYLDIRGSGKLDKI